MYQESGEMQPTLAGLVHQCCWIEMRMHIETARHDPPTSGQHHQLSSYKLSRKHHVCMQKLELNYGAR
jgi:hypothetical protein